MNRIKLLATLLLLSFASGVTAQDIHFSQFFEAPLLRNPSLAGLFTGDWRVQAVFHDQWQTVGNAYRTGSFNGEYKIPVGKANDFVTAGLQVLYDKAGTAALSTTELLPAFSYHKSLSDDKPMFLNLGLMGGMVWKSIDRSKVTTNSQYNGTAYDPALPDGETLLYPNVNYWDGSLGLSFNSAFGKDHENTYFFGAAMHHLNRPKNSFYKNPGVELAAKYVFSAGVKLTLNEANYFTIQADHSRQAGSVESIGGVLYSYKLGADPENSDFIFHLGGFLRWRDAFIPVIKLDMQALSVSLSYDVNVSELKTASQSRGGVELSISWIGLLDRENSRGGIPSPHF